MFTKRALVSMLIPSIIALRFLILSPHTAKAACVPGDADGSGSIDFGDGTSIVSNLCSGIDIANDCADADGDCDIDIWDAVKIIAFVFGGGGAPAPPGCVDPPTSFDPDVPDTFRMPYPVDILVSVGAVFPVPLWVFSTAAIRSGSAPSPA